MPRSRVLTSVYNPNDFPVDILTYVVTSTNEEIDVVVTIPPRSWKVLYETDDLLLKIRLYGLMLGTADPTVQPPANTGGLDGKGTYVNLVNGDYENVIKEDYEDYVEITADVMVLGYFATTNEVPMYHFDSTEFIPLGAQQQIYGIDYTMKNVNGITRVMFNKSLNGGPTCGLADVLSVGDFVSFRYCSEVI
jgi:hypothetical protein